MWSWSDKLFQIAAVFTAVGVVLGGIFAGLHRGRRQYRRGKQTMTAFSDAILGRDAVLHPDTGRVLLPPVPGIGSRMANQEEQMSVLTNAVSKIADSHVRIEKLEIRVTALEGAELDRSLARTEAIELYRTIDSAISAEPGEHDEIQP